MATVEKLVWLKCFKQWVSGEEQGDDDDDDGNVNEKYGTMMIMTIDKYDNRFQSEWK